MVTNCGLRYYRISNWPVLIGLEAIFGTAPLIDNTWIDRDETKTEP
jgi:hypothetical protein